MLNKFLLSIRMKSCIKRSVVSFFVFHTAFSVKQLGKKIILFLNFTSVGRELHCFKGKCVYFELKFFKVQYVNKIP